MPSPPDSDPARIRLEATVERAALLAGGGIRLFPPGLELVSRLIPSAERTSPLLLQPRPDMEWSLETELGRVPTDLPTPVELITPYGHLVTEIEERATGYRVEGRLHLEPGLLEPARIPELRSFLLRVERELARPLEVP